MFGWAALIVSSLIVGSNAHASSLSYGLSISSEEVTGSKEPVADALSVTDPNGPIGNTLSLMSGGNSATASAVAEFGRLQVVSEIVIDPSDDTGDLDTASATALWTENITIQAPSLDGTLGRFRAQIRVTGSLDAESFVPSNQSDAQWVIRGTFGQLGFANCAASNASPECGLVGDSLPATLTTPETGFRFGNPFQVAIQVLTFGRVSLGGSGSVDLSQSVEWIGFVEVRDADSNLITDFTVTSESGFDYGASLDTDGDGVRDAGLVPCATGETEGCSDNCPFESNAEGDDVQRDSDGNGRGDACECGNVDRNTSLNIFDALMIAQGTLVPPLVTMIHPRACDADGNGRCDIFDALRVAQATLTPPIAEIVQGCAAANSLP